MIKNIWHTAAAVAFLSAGVAAQESPLEIIPETASAVIRFQAPDKIKEDLSDFVDKVQPGFGGFIEAQFPTILGEISQNKTLDGLDLTNDWYMVMVLNEDGEPQPVLVLPTTDMEAAKEAVESTFEIAEDEDWLICAMDTALLEDFGNDDLESIESVLTEKSEARLASGHIGVFVNGEQLKEEFAEELESADQHLDELIDNIVQQAQQVNPAANMKAVAGMYKELGKLFLQAVRDSDSITVSLEFTEDAFQTDFLLTAGESTSTAKFFGSQPVSDMKRLTSIPEGMLGYVAAHGDPTVTVDYLRKFTSELITDEEVLAKMTKSLDLMKDARIGTVAGGGNLLPDEEGSLRYLVITEVQPTSVFRNAMKLLGDGLEYETAGIKIKQTYEPDTEKLDGTSVDILRTEQTMPEGLDPTGMQEAIQKKFYGSNGIEQRVLTTSDLMYQTIGGGLDAMKSLTTSKTWTDETLLKARAGLHEQANALMLVDMPNSLLAASRAVLSTNTLPLPIQASQLDGLEVKPSYSGFSMAVESNTLEARGTIPVDTFKGFTQIGMFVQGMRNQRQ